MEFWGVVGRWGGGGFEVRAGVGVGVPELFYGPGVGGDARGEVIEDSK